MIKRTVYIGNPTYLSLANRQLVLRQVDSGGGGDVRKTIPIEDIGVLVLDNQQITITSGVIAALLDNNTAVVTCDSKSMPSGLVLPLEGNSVQCERFADQIEASLPLKKQLWQQTVECKINNQAAVLKYVTGEDARNMLVWAGSVRSGDPENMEGRAAAFYWRSVFPEIPFFIRDRFEMAPNNLLNYGYAILRAIIARALVSSGLLPTLGIHHHNRYNAFCLADDIMEPYRPYVDRLVIDIMEDVGPCPSLTRDVKARLLAIPVLDVSISGQRSPLMVAASLTTSSLARCYSGESRKVVYPEM